MEKSIRPPAFAVYAAGCGCNGGSSPIVNDDIHSIILVSRSLQTGRFEAFEIKDQVFVDQVQMALRDDLAHADERSGLGLGMSVNHVVVLHRKDGNTSLYEILGDEFILVDSTRFPARRTVTVLRRAHADGAAVPISAEQARTLVPAVNGYLK